jgi:hypothetical protein
MKEGHIVKACMDWLYVHGCDPIRNNSGSAYRRAKDKAGNTREWYIRFGKKGSGDILACSPKGRWLEVECKVAKGQQQPEQVARQVEIERRGGIYVLARGVEDLEARKQEILS